MESPYRTIRVPFISTPSAFRVVVIVRDTSARRFYDRRLHSIMDILECYTPRVADKLASRLGYREGARFGSLVIAEIRREVIERYRHPKQGVEKW